MTAVTGDGAARASRRPAARGKPARLGILARPLASYHLVLASAILLAALGLVMVWSSSMVTSYKETGSSFSALTKQGMWLALGLPLMAVASRLPVRFIRALAYPILGVAILLLMALLVPGVGLTINGANRWIGVGSLTVQPSELAKLGLLLWGADLLGRKHDLRLLGTYKHLIVPLVPVAGFVVLLVMGGKDLGTTLVLLTILLAMLWIVGAPAKLFAAILGVIAFGVTILAVTEPYRLERLLNFTDPFKDMKGSGWQGAQGIYALASGGFWGVGLGSSREKWGYLPQAHSDFIFAIIGEELGLLGCLTVLTLFAVLAFAGIRIAYRSRDLFTRLAAGTIVAWLLAQALINIGAVIGMLPITGIPLPLISAGGSSLLPTMFAIGILLALARTEPAAAAFLAERRPGWLARHLAPERARQAPGRRLRAVPPARPRSSARPVRPVRPGRPARPARPRASARRG